MKFNTNHDRISLGFAVFALVLLLSNTDVKAQENVLLKTLSGHEGDVLAVAFSPDNKILASASQDKTIRLWDIQTGKLLRKLEGHTNIVNAITFSPDGKTLASGSHDGTVRIWDIMIGRSMNVLEQRDRAGEDGMVERRIHDGLMNPNMTISPEHIKTIKVKEERLFDKVVLSPNGRILACGGESTGGDLWAHGSVSGSIEMGFLSPYHSILQLWDIHTGKWLKTLYPRYIKSLVFSLDGENLAAGLSAGWGVTIWDVKTGEFKELREMAKTKSSSVYAIAFSPDSKTLITGIDDKTIKLWDVQTGNLLQTWEWPNDEILAATFSPDGKTLAIGNKEGNIKLWSVLTGKEIRVLEKHEGTVTSIAFSPDETMLASGSKDKTVKLWNIKVSPSKPISKNTDNTKKASSELMPKAINGTDPLLFLAEAMKSTGKPVDADGNGIINMDDVKLLMGKANNCYAKRVQPFLNKIEKAGIKLNGDDDTLTKIKNILTYSEFTQLEEGVKEHNAINEQVKSTLKACFTKPDSNGK